MMFKTVLIEISENAKKAKGENVDLDFFLFLGLHLVVKRSSGFQSMRLRMISVPDSRNEFVLRTSSRDISEVQLT